MQQQSTAAAWDLLNEAAGTRRALGASPGVKPAPSFRHMSAKKHIWHLSWWGSKSKQGFTLYISSGSFPGYLSQSESLLR